MRAIDKFTARVKQACSNPIILTPKVVTLVEISNIFAALREAVPLNTIEINLSKKKLTPAILDKIKEELADGGYPAFCLNLSEVEVADPPVLDIATAVAEALLSGECPAGMKFKLNGNKLFSNGIDKLGSVFIADNAPEQLFLELARCSLTVTELSLLTPVTWPDPCAIKYLSLDLGGNDFTDADVHLLTRVLARGSPMKCLSLSGTQVSKTWLSAFVHLFASEDSVQDFELNLDYCVFVAGCARLLQALSHSKPTFPLIHFSLKGCALSAKDLAALYHMIATNISLKSMDISNITIPEDCEANFLSSLSDALDATNHWSKRDISVAGSVKEPIKTKGVVLYNSSPIVDTYSRDLNMVMKAVVDATTEYCEPPNTSSDSAETESGICQSSIFVSHGPSGKRTARELETTIYLQSTPLEAWNAIRYHVDKKSGGWDRESYKTILMRFLITRIGPAAAQSQLPDNKEDALAYIDRKRAQLSPDAPPHFDFALTAKKIDLRA